MVYSWNYDGVTKTIYVAYYKMNVELEKRNGGTTSSDTDILYKVTGDITQLVKFQYAPENNHGDWSWFNMDTDYWTWNGN